MNRWPGLTGVLALQRLRRARDVAVLDQSLELRSRSVGQRRGQERVEPFAVVLRRDVDLAPLGLSRLA